MIELAIDIETYSPEPLPDTGVDKYCEHAEAEILLFAYRFTGEPTRLVDLCSGDDLPDRVLQALFDPAIIKTAHNAPFEIPNIDAYLLTRYKGKYPKLDVSQWRCTMVLCANMGLPLKLESAAEVLGLPVQKDRRGFMYIRMFTMPVDPEKHGGRTRNLPWDYPEHWNGFKGYNVRDVDVECAIKDVLRWFVQDEREHPFWVVDQRINRRGVRVDLQLLRAAILIDQEHQDRILEEAKQLTGFSPRQLGELKKWLEKAIIEEDEDVDFSRNDKLNAKELPKLVAKLTSERIKRVLELRALISKTSITKYRKMLVGACSDERLKGCTQFYGAGRTGRFAGRRIQPQNYPKNYMDQLDLAREVVKMGDIDTVELVFGKGSVPFVLSQLLRTSFIPAAGKRFIIVDYAQIEARVLAWLAGEQWVLEAFRRGEDLYIAAASQMFGIPKDQITKKSPERQRGKVAVLAFGYQGAVGAAINMGALDMGIPEKELPILVVKYRQANPHIVQFWYDLQNAAIHVLTTGERVRLNKGIEMYYEKRCFIIRLPSGRKLVYIGACYDRNSGSIMYQGTEQNKKWGRLSTYGGKLAENITQAIARDLLREGMLSLENAGYEIVMHVHDEVIIEAPIGWGSLAEAEKLMCPVIPWAEGLPLEADGFEHHYYKKED